MRLTDSASAGSTRDRLRDIQHEILEATASGRPLAGVMDLLCRRVEELDSSLICSVLSVDAEGFLHPLAAPSLPDSYSNALEGLKTGPVAGSCGTAAWRGESVTVSDIANDPLWADYKDLGLSYGLRACSSSPIKARDNRVVGTFAFYYRTVREPSQLERMIVGTCVHLCAIAIEQEESRTRIHQLAYYDPLTGLPNRLLFQQRAGEIFAAPVPDDILFAIHYLDLDDFKSVNDTLGHHIGDALLKEVGARLTRCAGETDLVARLGGDEFAVVQTSARHKGEVRSLAGALINAIGQPFELYGQTVTVRGSIGFTTVSGQQTGLDVLMRQADLAVYEAKGDGGGTYRSFDPLMFKRAMTRRAIEQDLRRADFDRELELVYQPIIALKSGELTGGEALIRWNHPERGLIPPAEFIPIAEECGQMARLGEWIVRTASREASRWPAHMQLSINISPVQFRRPGFALNVVRKLREAGLAPQRVQFEITETALLNDANSARTILQQFKDVGISIALDDFGTGYSSLSHLRSFPIDTIKIDRSFVQEFGHGEDSTAIIRAVLTLARDLGMSTTAEGIETPEQLADLTAAGCTHAQGFHLGRPMKRMDFEALIATQHGVTPAGAAL